MSIINKFAPPSLKTRLLGKLKPFFDQNREKILVTLGVVVVVIVAFFLGRHSTKIQSNTLGGLKGEVNVPVKHEIKKQKNAVQENIDETATSDTSEGEGEEEEE